VGEKWGEKTLKS